MGMAEDALAGAAADDVEGGLSVSGVGGEETRTALDEVIERAQQTSWGRDPQSRAQLAERRG